jgi:hypothetical protein
MRLSRATKPFIVFDADEESGERFLTSEELARLGDVLREAETVGLPWTVDEKKPKAKNLLKFENRRTAMDPFAIAAIRLWS